jgi:hypothetical protein
MYNEFNIHEIAHMKHLPSMSTLLTPKKTKKQPMSNSPSPPTNGGFMDPLCLVLIGVSLPGLDLPYFANEKQMKIIFPNA